MGVLEDDSRKAIIGQKYSVGEKEGTLVVHREIDGSGRLLTKSAHWGEGCIRGKGKKNSKS